MLSNMKNALLVLAWLNAIFSGVVCQVTVNGNTGSFVGTQDEVLKVDKFIGIPYAQPPVGKLRLQAPQAIVDNLGTVNVQGPTSNKCYGIENNMLRVGSEDCLHLDVVRPSNNQPLLPVYVFLHGGEFNSGDKSDIDSSNLVTRATSLRYPFIFVSVNYRLSFLGFPGGVEAGRRGAHNLGLHDQRMALQWVQANIQDFGGDPNKVVLGGQASGADAVAYQMLAYGGNNQNLFRGLFLESGAATTLTPIPHPNYTIWQTHYDDIVARTKCKNMPTGEFDCLQVLPIDVLTNAMYNVFTMSYSIPHHVYAPVTDGTFLQAYPSVLMTQRKFAAIPTVIGHTTNELVDRIPTGQNFSSDASILGFASYFTDYVPMAILQRMVTLYPASEFPDDGPPGSGPQFGRVVQIDNELQSFCPVHRTSLQLSEKAPVYKYRWDARHSTTTASPFFKVSQGQDLPFLFGPSSVNPTPDDTVLANSYQAYLAAFITSLDPNDCRRSVQIQDWPQYTDANQNQLVFGTIESGGVRTEKDGVNFQRCDFIDAHNLDFFR